MTQYERSIFCSEWCANDHDEFPPEHAPPTGCRNFGADLQADNG